MRCTHGCCSGVHTGVCMCIYAGMHSDVEARMCTHIQAGIYMHVAMAEGEWDAIFRRAMKQGGVSQGAH